MNAAINSRRWWWGSWFALVLLLVGAAGVCRAEDPAKLVNPTDSYVADFANVIDEGSKAELQALCAQVHDKAGTTIKVVTVQTLDGADLSDFSIRLAENWKVGAKGTDKGVIFLVAMKEHKDRIEVGYGLEGILNDAKVGDIRRSMHAQFAAGQYGPALLGGVRQVANVIATDAGVTLDQAQAPVDDTPAPVRRHRAQPSMLGTIFRVGFFLFVLFILFRGGRGGRGGGGGSGLGWFLLGNMLGGGGGGRNDWGGGGGGGSWGGGGGGGGDSGGSFGGGGAGGDW